MSDNYSDEDPKVYSRKSIVIFSLLLSTIFGGLMYIQNLSATGNKQPRIAVFLFSLFWQTLAGKLLRQVTDNAIYSVFAVNLIGGVILAFPFWNHHFKDVDFTQYRSWWTPIAIVIITYGGLIGLHLWG